MRILVALIAVFMVSGARAQCPITDPLCISFAITEAKCQFESKGPWGPIYECKDPKTNEVVAIECKVPASMAKKMPTKLSGAELQKGYGKMCYVPDGRNDGKVS